jgi:hypothetical protein
LLPVCLSIPLSLQGNGSINTFPWQRIYTQQDKNFFEAVSSMWSVSYQIVSMQRGWVFRLQLLLTLASAVILRLESRLLLQIRGSSNLEGQVPVFISPRTGWPTHTSKHWVPFSSPPTTSRDTMEVFDGVATRVSLSCNPRFTYNPQHGQRRKQSSSTFAPIISVESCLFAKPLPSKGRVYLLIQNLLPDSECCFAVRLEAVTQQRLDTLH